MADAMGRYQETIGRITAWAESQENVRFAIIIGSLVRTSPPADQWSDLDVAMLARDPELLTGSTAWLDLFGRVVCTFTEGTAVGPWQERRVLYADNRDIDFAILSANIVKDPQWIPLLGGVLSRGFKVLLDKDGSGGLLGLAKPSGDSRGPIPAEFENDVNDFYYHLVWARKKLKRGETWTATVCINSYLSRLLLRMLTWYAWAVQPRPIDTWFAGRFLEEWAPAEIQSRLAGCFTRYSATDAADSLRALRNLYRELASLVAQRSGYQVPPSIDAEVTRLMTAMEDPSPR